MKAIKNYILLVDSYRRPERRRNTAGRYRVGAKSPEEAVKLLREKIGFGSIRVYYECTPDNQTSIDGPPVGYKEVVQEILVQENGKMTRKRVEPHHATSPRQKDKGEAEYGK